KRSLGQDGGGTAPGNLHNHVANSGGRAILAKRHHREQQRHHGVCARRYEPDGSLPAITFCNLTMHEPSESREASWSACAAAPLLQSPPISKRQSAGRTPRRFAQFQALRFMVPMREMRFVNTSNPLLRGLLPALIFWVVFGARAQPAGVAWGD